MLGVMISWLRLDTRSATVAAVLLVVLALLTRRRSGRVSRFVTTAAAETALICALFALWQVAGGLTRGRFAGGFDHGMQLWRFERWLHLPSEVAVQRPILDHPLIVQAANYYYDTAHLTLMALFLPWLWLRHRDRYPFWRNAMVGFTAMALLMQFIPVAPPRLIPVHMTDTAMLYGQSVYAAIPSNLGDVYAAMPSIHVGWAVLIGLAVVRSSPSRWRWLALLHPILTVWVVVVTANHYWLDGVVAVFLLAIAGAGAMALRRSVVRRRAVATTESAEPQPVGAG